MNQVGIGIVGAGGIFEQHARAVRECSPRARLVAVCDLDEARLADAANRHGIPAASRHHEQLVTRDDVDLVVVCTPPSFHAAVVVDALAAGKHVICEKPLAHTLADADRIIQAAQSRPGRLSVVYQFRHLTAVRRAVWLRDRGALGSLLSGRFHRFARFHRPGKPQRSGWWGRWDVAGGGAVMTQLIHELDLICLFFGRPGRVWAVADTLKEAIESEDTCAAVVQFETGAICTAQATMSAHRSSAGFDLFGTDGSAHAPWSFECLDRDRRGELRRAALEAVPDDPQDADRCAHTPYLAAVLDALEAGEPLPSGADQARLSLELASAIYASSLSGEAVALPLEPGHPQYEGVEASDYATRRRGGREAVGVE
ncbi:MAG TPA: Gfo/Idh/MocA family oxidoreductase [Solirubrobacteraceae bacterium]|nr:Gfo/Idh/MocA family oxidoreductase [Solirubrobacteraceae bacterium]